MARGADGTLNGATNSFRRAQSYNVKTDRRTFDADSVQGIAFRISLVSMVFDLLISSFVKNPRASRRKG